MKPSDRPNFAQLLSDAMAFYRQDVSKFALSVWWQACETYELEQVAKAITAHAMDPERGQFAPKPADIVRQLQGTRTDRSLIAWGKVLDAMQRVGAYKSVVFDDGLIHASVEDCGGWVAMCRGNTDDLPFVQRRFCASYQAYATRPDVRYPARLAGAFELENRVKGYRPPAPVLIGDPAQAGVVMLEGSHTGKTQITAGEAIQMPRQLGNAA